MRPKLSIVTINFNNKAGLIKTLKSIKEQTYTQYEHVIIDANSTDGSKDVILEYGRDNPYLTYWVSEPDKGIYDGMNKGINYARGEYLFFLNSGDYLIDKNVLSSITFDGTQFICGNIRIEYLNDTYEDIISPHAVDAIYLLRGFLPHPASFMHYSLFKENKYRTDFLIVSDWIHMIKSLIFDGCSYKHINLFVSIFDSTGLSSQKGDLGQIERDTWIKNQLSMPIYDALMELDTLRNSELGNIIPLILSKRKKAQKRIKRIILLLVRLFK